jgi:hypothetical protein
MLLVAGVFTGVDNTRMPPTKSIPIACTLSSGDFKSRSQAWRRLLQTGEVERIRVPGGLQLRPTAASADALVELIDWERECCAWITFQVAPDSTVTLTAAGDGELVLAGMFDLSD